MGGSSYWYYAMYQSDIDTTLQNLRKREFEAGRYYPALTSDIIFPVGDDNQNPGAQHSSIEEAMEAAQEGGTQSILDMFQTSSVPYEEALNASTQDGIELFCTTFPVSTDELYQLFNTEKPTHKMVEEVILLSQKNREAADVFWESVDRGRGKHILIYKDNKPVEVFFVGCSFD